MKRSEIIEKLLSEGFTEKTLSRLGDMQLATLAKTVLTEEDVMISKKDPQLQQKIANAKRTNQTIVTYEEEMSEEKPSAGLSKEKKSEIVKKAKKGEDIGKKGKSFKDIEAKAKESGAKDPKAVAAAAMWKSVKRESVENKNEIEEWVLNLAESKFSTFTSKGDIMSVITEKVKEAAIAMPATKPTKGHNGVPEFMTFDAIVGTQPETTPAQPDIDTPVKPETPEKPSKPKTPYQPGPGTDPKPKAMGEEKKVK